MGRGGGGTELGVSRPTMERWRAFIVVSSAWRDVSVVLVVLMALVEGSTWIGRSVKVSRSMIAVAIV